MVPKSSPNRFCIGFLLFDQEIEFDEGKVVPIPEFAKVRADVEERLNLDGYLYPPLSRRMTRGPEEDSEPEIIPHSERPAFLHPVYPSHDLFLNQQAVGTDPRKGIAGFVLHLLAFIFRTRLQFADWWLDGRISVKGYGQRMNGVLAEDATWIGSYISQACSVWRTWPQAEQTRFTSILYMFSRAASYEWDWEEFMIQYTVLDACWKMSETLFGLRSKGHGDRMAAMCSHFRLTWVHGVIDFKKMVELRNDLFHEALWVGERPGQSDLRSLGYSPGMRLWLLTKQLIRSFLKIGP